MGIELLSEQTERELRKDHTFKERDKIKPLRKKELLVRGGYDMLAYFGIVRKYFQARYELTFEELELFFYLYPINFFTKKDYRRFPLSWGNKRFKTLIYREFFKKVSVDDGRVRGCVYMLTRQGKQIVEDFHRMLAGEKEIPTNPQLNPYFHSEANAYRLQAREIMLEMRKRIKEQNIEE